MSAKPSGPVYFQRLTISNIKAFGDEATLDLRFEDRVAQWTLIVGDNGLGKTTLLQCLALLRPIANVVVSKKTNASEPDWVEPALPGYENAELIALARTGEGLTSRLEAEFAIGVEFGQSPEPKHTFTTSAEFSTTAKHDLGEFKFSQERRPGFVEPLFIAYGAARHVPYSKANPVADPEDAAASVFNPAIELADPATILERLDYAEARKELRAGALMRSIKAALKTLLPGLAPDEPIVVYPPPLPGAPAGKSGVWIKTYSGEIPFSGLSLGYQTMAAWAVDLAWRMAEKFPEADNPLAEPAIVLIDELDLHLHPRWQRGLRQEISTVFPRVQFIATAHSPLLAQTYLDTNLAVVRRSEGQAGIDNDPAVARTWRLDEVVSSVLYEMGPYGPEIETAMRTRAELLQRGKLDPADEQRLQEANAVVARVPTQADPEDQEARDFLRKTAELIRTRPT